MTALVPYELPENWVWTSLADIADIIMGSSPPSSSYNKEKAGLPFYQGKTDFGSLSPTPRVWCSSPYKVAEEGDVVISVRAPVGPTNLCTEKSCIGRGLGAIRPRAGIPCLFVLFYLRSIEKNVAQMGIGSTFTAIKRSDLESLPFPLAPLNEQRRIVAKIEALFTESKTAREALAKVPVLLRRFRQSVLAKAFKGELTQRDPNDEPAQKLLERLREHGQTKLLETKESQGLELTEMWKLPESWTWARLGELLEILQYGTSEKADSTEDIGIPILRMGNIQENGLDLSDLKYIALDEDQKNKYLLKKEDILINRTNSPELVGKSAIFNLDKEFVFASYLIRLQPNPKAIISPYLNFFINSIYGRRYIERVKHQVAGQANINSKNIKNMPISVAPLEEQKRVVARIEEAFSLSDQVEIAAKKARERAERIDQAILTKAFKGELVPQDPNDEPASILLQRLKTK